LRILYNYLKPRSVQTQSPSKVPNISLSHHFYVAVKSGHWNKEIQED